MTALPPQCAQPSPWSDTPCGKRKPSAGLTALRTNRLRNVILEGISILRPHEKASPGAGLFRGSFDWHSAVHAHWALLSIARTRGDSGLEARLRKRFNAGAVQAERKFLNGDQSFENPYGRAWLLMVLSELARRSWAPNTLAAFRTETEDVVLQWLEMSAYPESSTEPKFIATHNSWLFAYLLMVLSQPRPDAVKRLGVLRKKKLEPQRAAVARAKHTPDDFLYLPAVQAMIDRIDPATVGTPAAFPAGESPALPDPPLTFANAHSAGAALVRIWPHAIDSHAGDKKACARFQARMNEMFSRTDQWADAFDLVAHWVPQFMWMALWLEAGRP